LHLYETFQKEVPRLPNRPNDPIRRGYAVAIKEIPSKGGEYIKEEEAFNRTQELPGDHLIKMICSFRRGESYFFVLPLADGGDLVNMWYTLNSKPRTQDRIKWILSQMEGLAGAIKSLNNLRQVEDGETVYGRHGDVKPENILHFHNGDYKGFGVLKISDLGLAKFHQEVTEKRPDPTTENRFSKPYAPPEGCKPGKRGRKVRYVPPVAGRNWELEVFKRGADWTIALPV
jgi:serine/threonine protein kinase